MDVVQWTMFNGHFEQWALENGNLTIGNREWIISIGRQHLTFRVESGHWTIDNMDWTMDNKTMNNKTMNNKTMNNKTMNMGH